MDENSEIRKYIIDYLQDRLEIPVYINVSVEDYYSLIGNKDTKTLTIKITNGFVHEFKKDIEIIGFSLFANMKIDYFLDEILGELICTQKNVPGQRL